MSDRNVFDHGRRIAELERKVSDLYERLGQAEPTSLSADESGAAASPSVVAAEDPRLVELVQGGEELKAIKLYRELTGVGLKEAKDAVDELKRMHQPLG